MADSEPCDIVDEQLVDPSAVNEADELYITQEALEEGHVPLPTSDATGDDEVPLEVISVNTVAENNDTEETPQVVAEMDDGFEEVPAAAEQVEPEIPAEQTVEQVCVVEGIDGSYAGI